MKIGQTDEAYGIIKIFFKERNLKILSIADRHEEVIYDHNKVAGRWKEYLVCMQKIVIRNVKFSEVKTEQEDGGDPIVVEEFENAMDELKDEKIPSIDGIPAELLKKIGGKL